mgnify:CR=1 FL=1
MNIKDSKFTNNFFDKNLPKNLTRRNSQNSQNFKFFNKEKISKNFKPLLDLKKNKNVNKTESKITKKLNLNNFEKEKNFSKIQERIFNKKVDLFIFKNFKNF